MYLLEETLEAVEMRQRICMMLESDEESQILLGLQLLKGGGVHPTHLSYLLALSVWQGFDWDNAKSIKMKATLLFRQGATPEMLAYQKTNPLHTVQQLAKYDCNYEPNFTKYLTHYALEAQLDIGILAVMALLILGNGGKYLLEHKPRPVAWILEKMLHAGYYNTLNLSNFGLAYLPEEVGNFSELQILNLTGNPLQDIPDSLQQLKNLYDVAFDYKTVSEVALEKLMRFFPDIVAEKFYGYACDAKRKVKKVKFPQPNPHPAYLEAIPLFEKACQIKPDYAEVWHNVGACWVFYGEPEKGKEALLKALACYQERIDSPQNQGYSFYNYDRHHNLFWQSCIYALLQEKQKGLDLLQILKEEQATYHLRNATQEEDWAMYHQDADFKAICA